MLHMSTDIRCFLYFDYHIKQKYPQIVFDNRKGLNSKRPPLSGFCWDLIVAILAGQRYAS